VLGASQEVAQNRQEEAWRELRQEKEAVAGEAVRELRQEKEAAVAWEVEVGSRLELEASQ
jgi:hypothetical protein